MDGQGGVQLRNSQDDEHTLLATLALIRIKGLGTVTQARLLEYFHSPKALFAAAPGQLTQMVGVRLAERLSSPPWQQAERDLQYCRRHQIELITLASSRYPPLLRAIVDPPPVLFARGSAVSGLAQPSVAVVGTRRPTLAGTHFTTALGADLARAGLTVVSGLAHGVDGAAHRGALAGGGDTVAVGGCGLDRIYPRSHRALAAQIEQSGCLITEFAPGTPPLRHNFPMRNRLISGLSLGVVIVEAAERSGSLVTARLALEQGREVMAVPGAPGAAASAGTNRLLREGAALVCGIRDVLDELASPLEFHESWECHAAVEDERAPTPVTASAARILDALSAAPQSLDKLAQLTRLEVSSLRREIQALELEGHLEMVPGGLYGRTLTRYTVADT
ncbi:MAG: DNA-protecting protein DprA [Gammaproteobacteria bacterium]|nr:DNA-protecting protein DprA [Gammaproteobacteria bacterium]